MTTATINKVKFSPFSKGYEGYEVETLLQVPSDEEFTSLESNPNIGIFRILDQKSGDKRLVWNRLSMGDISEAHNLFNKFIGQGLAAYRVGGDGKTGAKMDTFDPTAEEVIFMPVKLIAGG